MFLWRKIVLQKMTSNWPCYFSRLQFTAANLKSTIFDLCNLTSINLNNRAGSKNTPSVPEMSHTYFEAEHSNSF
jgi:uncharacterized protein YjbI with pentapeptide repeats